MIHYLKYYREIVKVNINLKMAYQLNFWLGCISDIILYSIQIAVFQVIYCKVDAINGWSMNQIIFFLGVFFFIDSLAMVTLVLGIASIPDMIRTGGLDLFIVKPINPLFNIATSKFEISFVPNIIYGVALMIYAASRLKMHITIPHFLCFLVMLLVMYMLYLILMTIAYTFSFWFIKVTSIIELHHQLVDMSFRVPGVAYTGIWKKIFMFILPYGLIATVPTQIFTDWQGTNMVIKSLVVVAGFFGIMVLVWRRGLKQYNSASS